jgi:hypothetical protein
MISNMMQIFAKENHYGISWSRTAKFYHHRENIQYPLF